MLALCLAISASSASPRRVAASERAALTQVGTSHTAGPIWEHGPGLPPLSGGSDPSDGEVASLAPIDIPEIDLLMREALATKKTPGAVIAVGRRAGVVFLEAYGQREIVPRRVPMTTDTIFDLASITKPLVVGTLVQVLIDQGRLDLADPAVTHLPEFDDWLEPRVTLEQLLLHTSGLPASNPLSEYRGTPSQALARTLESPVLAMPGRRFEYSDVGYISLGVLIERATGERLDVLARRLLWQPLGLTDTGYCVPACRDLRVAPTDIAPDRSRSPLRGVVNDPRAYRLGGVAGHAGLFSTAPDLSRYARMLLGGGEVDGVRVLSPEAVRRFTEPRAVPGGLRNLGWDVSVQFQSPRGTLLSPRAFGHTGYTGTAFWIDPEQDLFVIFLSNRIHPWGHGRVLELEGAVVDAAVRALVGDRGGVLTAAAADPGSSAAPDVAPPDPAGQ